MFPILWDHRRDATSSHPPNVEILKRLSRHSSNFSRGATLVDRNDAGPLWFSRKHGLSKSWAILAKEALIFQVLGNCFSVLIFVLFPSCGHPWSVFLVANIDPV